MAIYKYNSYQDEARQVFKSIVPPLTIYGRHTGGIFQNDIYVYIVAREVLKLPVRNKKL